MIQIMFLKTQRSLKKEVSRWNLNYLPGFEQVSLDTSAGSVSRMVTNCLGNKNPLPLQKSMQWYKRWCKLVFSVNKYEALLYKALNLSLLSNFTLPPHFNGRKTTITITSSICFLLTVESKTKKAVKF